jgi:hypothetical protein
MSVIPNFSWLPWYLQIAVIFPMVLFIILALWRLIMGIVDLVLKVKGAFF